MADSACGLAALLAGLDAAVAELPADALPALLARLAAAQGAASARLLVLLGGNHTAPELVQDQLLDVEEAAKRLAVSKDWLYRRASRLPFTVRLGPGALRFSAAGIARWLRQRQGRR